MIAIWTNGNAAIAADIDRMIEDFSRDVVGPYWPRERRHVDESYRDLVLPFPAIESPAFEMQTHWNAAEMLGYLDTWSAVRRQRAHTGWNGLGLLSALLAAAWGDAPRRVRWPLVVKAGRA